MRIAGALVFPPPEFILLGDSMVRSVAIPKGITYSFSGAKVLDLLLYAPAIIERHPSAHTIILHCGVNDLRYRQSLKLRVDSWLKLLRAWAKDVFFSGLVPSLRWGSEMFSRLYGADQ